MFIGIGQGGFRRSSQYTQMDKLSQTTTQSIADLTQRIGARQLTEQHRHKLRPTGESFGITFSLMLRNQSGKLCSREMLQKLIKQTRDLYHSAALLFELVLTPLPSKAGVERETWRAFYFVCPFISNPFWTRKVYDRAYSRRNLVRSLSCWSRIHTNSAR